MDNLGTSEVERWLRPYALAIGERQGAKEPLRCVLVGLQRGKSEVRTLLSHIPFSSLLFPSSILSQDEEMETADHDRS